MDKSLTVIPKANTPTPSRVGCRKGEPKLKTLKDIRSELAAIYRRTFYRAEMLPEDYSRAVYGLRCLAEVVEAVEFEERLVELEKKS